MGGHDLGGTILVVLATPRLTQTLRWIGAGL
jgi:hypothetical protein